MPDRFKLPGRGYFGEGANEWPPPRLCHVCDIKLDDEEYTDYRKCDGCGMAGCQHTIANYDDERFKTQRLYCAECAQKID